MGLARDVWRAPIALVPRVEQLAYLLMPIWQALVGLALIVAIVLCGHRRDAVLGRTAPAGSSSSSTCSAFGGVVLGCVAGRAARRAARRGCIGFLVAHLYALYTWLLWPVLVRSTARQLTERSDWAKTEREPLVGVGLVHDQHS